MRLITLVTILFCLMSASLIAQTKKAKPDIYELPIPKNLSQCFKALDRTMDDSLINLIKNSPEDSIDNSKRFIEREDFFHAWKIYNGSRLTKYFNKQDLYEPYPIYETIMITYHRYLNKLDLNLSQLIAKYRKQQEDDYAFYVAKQNKDTLNGVYIPKNIEDCLTQLNKLISTEDKKTFTKKDEKAAVESFYSLNPGLWIRNNWGLWGGSRLQKYFSDAGEKDPEGMSVIILTAFHRRLNDKPIDFERLIKKK